MVTGYLQCHKVHVHFIEQLNSALPAVKPEVDADVSFTSGSGPGGSGSAFRSASTSGLTAGRAESLLTDGTTGEGGGCWES